MTDTTQKLVDLFRGNMPLNMYHGDFMRDAADQLDSLSTMSSCIERIRNYGPEAARMLPAGNEWNDIIDDLTGMTDNVSYDVKSKIEGIVLNIELKQTQITDLCSNARDILMGDY